VVSDFQHKVGIVPAIDPSSVTSIAYRCHREPPSPTVWNCHLHDRFVRCDRCRVWNRWIIGSSRQRPTILIRLSRAGALSDIPGRPLVLSGSRWLSQFQQCRFSVLAARVWDLWGNAGSYVLQLLQQLAMPVVTTLHTVLREPDLNQRVVMQQIAARSDRLIVMSEYSSHVLQDVFGVPSEKIDLIPHGIPDLPFVEPDVYKESLSIGGKAVLLTFGLLSPNKGFESVIQALPRILSRHKKRCLRDRRRHSPASQGPRGGSIPASIAGLGQGTGS
jgi:glycosyltransferase involved in cell wall biosynthesis